MLWTGVYRIWQCLHMANQRQKGKKLRTFWVTEEEDTILVMLASRIGMSVSDYLKRPILDEIKRYPHKYKPRE